MEEIIKENYRGYEIVVEIDEFAESPRVEFSTRVSLAIDESGMCQGLGDNDSHDVQGTLACLIDEFVSRQDVISRFCNSGNAGTCNDDVDVRDLYAEMAIAEQVSMLNATGQVYVQPIVCYEHSCVSLTVGVCPDKWDGRYLGIAYARREDVAECGGDWYEVAQGLMQTDVAEYSAWLNGEVYRLEVSGPNGESVDSEGGFIGLDAIDAAVTEARCIVDMDVKQKKRMHTEKILKFVESSDRIIGYTFLDKNGLWHVGADLFGHGCLEFAPANDVGIIGAFRQAEMEEVADDVLDCMLYAAQNVLPKCMTI